ncbi:hypothetical protein [Salinimicrobium sp. GXAS 041]|uniref:hypothetical protein n=1 Tax=Salinimicrobium sp. GXAS 041 TaxID=3400806 RepID=UPI003C72CA24
MLAKYSNENLKEVLTSTMKLLAKTAALKVGKSFIKRGSVATIGTAAAFGIGYYAYRALKSRK